MRFIVFIYLFIVLFQGHTRYGICAQGSLLVGFREPYMVLWMELESAVCKKRALTTGLSRLKFLQEFL